MFLDFLTRLSLVFLIQFGFVPPLYAQSYVFRNLFNLATDFVFENVIQMTIHITVQKGIGWKIKLIIKEMCSIASPHTHGEGKLLAFS